MATLVVRGLVHERIRRTRHPGIHGRTAESVEQIVKMPSGQAYRNRNGGLWLHNEIAPGHQRPS